jgi:hypothetical protein
MVSGGVPFPMLSDAGDLVGKVWEVGKTNQAFD